jgi:HK97 family phage prohead protease
MAKELRYFDAQYELREEESGNVLEGYAAVFDTLSSPLGWGFREKIAMGAFDNVLNNDVRALFNHDANIVLGRTVSQTLSLSVDSKGLKYRINLPDTNTAKDLMKLIKRGDVTQNSFAFTIEDQEWIEDDEKREIRIIKKFKRLYDISPVTYPAYPEATIKRSEAFPEKKETETPLLNKHKYKLALIEAQNK